MELSFTSKYKDLLWCNYWYWFTQRRFFLELIRFMAIGLLGSILVAMVYLYIETQRIFWPSDMSEGIVRVPGIAIGVWVIFNFIFYPIQLFIEWRKMKKLDQEMRWRIRDEDVEIELAGATVKINWTHFKSLKETSKFYILCLKDYQGYYYLPKAVFDSSDKERKFRDFMSQKELLLK